MYCQHRVARSKFGNGAEMISSSFIDLLRLSTLQHLSLCDFDEEPCFIFFFCQHNFPSWPSQKIHFCLLPTACCPCMHI